MPPKRVLVLDEPGSSKESDWRDRPKPPVRRSERKENELRRNEGRPDGLRPLTSLSSFDTCLLDDNMGETENKSSEWTQDDKFIAGAAAVFQVVDLDSDDSKTSENLNGAVLTSSRTRETSPSPVISGTSSINHNSRPISDTSGDSLISHLGQLSVNMPTVLDVALTPMFASLCSTSQAGVCIVIFNFYIIFIYRVIRC